jgi:NADH-quinone oxidoreductase subunit A
VSDSLVPVFLALAAAAAIAAGFLAMSHLLGRPRKSQVDRSPYECGSRPFTSTQSHRYSVKFYLVAMLFILFDIEVAFLYPWAVTFRGFGEARVFVLCEMAVFLGILVAGFVYVWRRGALEWD